MLAEAAEREWVLDELAKLAAVTGWEPLVAAPILLPEARFFPDRWTPDVRGVLRLVRRFHRYFSIDELEPHVEIYWHDRPLLPGIGIHAPSQHHEGAAAYFAGIEGGVCLYGIDEAQLDDPIAVTAALAHEACHAFRTHYGLALRDPEHVDAEERLTDLTTVYLGAGVLTANATEQYSSSGLDGGLLQGHQWRSRQLGYLAPEVMCFALAAVVALRDLGRGERKAILNALAPNHAERFRTSLVWIETEVPNLRARLGVPADRASWPEPFELDDVEETVGGVESLAEYERAGAVTDGSTERNEFEGRWNEGQPVFRVRQGYDRGGYFGLAIVPAILGVIGVLILPVMGGLIGIVTGAALYFGVRGLVRRFALPRCSHPACSARLPPKVDRCPSCGGIICGVIDGAHQRLAAEEAWLEAQGLADDA